jgi:signal transduction histidine kinase
VHFFPSQSYVPLTRTAEVRFKQYGLATIEVIDNGGGIAEENYEGPGTLQ